MKFTQLFTKTKRQAPKDEVAVSAQLLARGGFVFKNMAGVYSFLPLGINVSEKISQIFREEMNAIDGQELHLNILQDKLLWQKTGRWDKAKEVMYQFKSDDKEFGLGFTHEEVIAQIGAQYINSYKDLPKYVYQIQTKFRNEPRVQAGLLRGREFLMKDLYSLSATGEDLDIFYEKAASAYEKIFKRLGLRAIRTKASGGLFSKYSDEFQVLSDIGEDTIFLCEKCLVAKNKEIVDENGMDCSSCGGTTLEKRAIEVGNIFKLGTKFSEPLGLMFNDKNGKQKPVIMGSYGIGIGRAMATVVEVHHDDKGILWPASVAPFKIHLVHLNKNADDIYNKLMKEGIDVLYDDRDNVSAGEKLADADLIGCPLRVVVSPMTGDKIELKFRNSDETKLVTLDNFVDTARKL